MSFSSSNQLHQDYLSLNHHALTNLIAERENVLLIQDLDGVCMGLVKDPLQRIIDPAYVKATKLLAGHFYVLTNGEHIGDRGVNGIVERAFNDPNQVQEEGLYLPGLGAGGVQWQDRYGNVSHPGVSQRELNFLDQVSAEIKQTLVTFFQEQSLPLTAETIEHCIQASVLNNQASPTANLNTCYEHLKTHPGAYLAMQKEVYILMEELLANARKEGLDNSFFVHYAPNLGRDEKGQEILRFAQEKDSGTTDFQFMLKGAIKEAGVLFILNHYYYQKTGNYPLGADFNVRQAPQELPDLLQIVKENFDPQQMPLMIGIGDTVNSNVIAENGQITVRRGGSDRNFLQLIKNIGQTFNTGNLTVYIDSSQGEVKNRKPLKVIQENNQFKVREGPGDNRDLDDPLQLNIAFPQGHQQYINFFQNMAIKRQQKLIINNR